MIAANIPSFKLSCFGGGHVHFGNNVYANFNLTLVDDTHIYVGDNTMFGPNDKYNRKNDSR